MVQQIRGADENALVALHALQHLVDFGHFVGALGATAILQEAVSLVQQKDRLFGFRLAEHRRHLLFGLADIFAHQVAGLLDQQGLAQALGDVLAQGGLAGARRAVKTQAAVATGPKCQHDTRDFEAALDVEHRQVVLGGHRSRRVQVGVVAQRMVGIAQLALDQLLGPEMVEAGRAGDRRRMDQPGEAHCGADLRRGEALARGQALHKLRRHRHPFEGFAHQALTCPGRRRFQLQVVGEAAPESRVDLLDAVGDPDRRHGVGFQNLVDPGLAADAATGGRRDLIGPCQQLRRFAGDRRKYVLHLVEQKRGLRAALEEYLRDLQRTVAVASAERVAVAVGIFHLEQIQVGGLRDDLGEFGLAGAGRPVQQNVDAGFLARHGMAQQGAQYLRFVADKGEIRHAQSALARWAGEHGHQFGLVPVFAHQYGRQFLAYLHQVGQVGDVVLGDQVLDQADTLQPRAGAQGLPHVAGVHAGQFGDRCVGFRRAVDLELDQDAAQVTLVPRQGAVQQQGPFRPVELQQAGQGIDVLFHQGGVFLERLRQPVAGGGQQRNQVLGLVLGIFVEIEEQRALLVRSAPGAVPDQEFGVAQGLVPTPVFVARATPDQKLAQAPQGRCRPHQVAAGQPDHTVEIAPHVEVRSAPGGQCQHKVRTHQVENRRVLEPR